MRLIAALSLAAYGCTGVARGEAFFRESCARCHTTAEQGSGRGPGLGGVFGRRAGSGPGFGYSAALRSSRIVWGEASLDSFLAGPGEHVPGSLMQLAIPDPDQRKDVVRFLATLRGGR
jgi:cytochrome c